MNFRSASSIAGATLALCVAGSAQAGWDGYIKSNVSQFGEPVKLEIVSDGGGYRLKGNSFQLPIEYRAEVDSRGRKLRQIDVNVVTVLQGAGKTAGLRRDLNQKAAWGKTLLVMNRAHLAPMEAQARKICASHNSAKPKEVAARIPLQMTVYFDPEKASHGMARFTKDGDVPAVIVCPGQPKRESVDLKLTDLKVYTLPAKPACGKPVQLVAEFWTNKPGKVDFQLFRGDGERQKASVETAKAGKGYVKRWGKSYTFDKSESRKYMILVTGHPASSDWVPINVNCVGKNARPGELKG
jgi:hypothetical protein